MKIAAANIESFIQNIANSKLKAILLYGPDQGLASTRANVIAKILVPELSNSFRYHEMNFENLKDEYATALYSMPLGGGRKLIKINNASSFSKEFQNIFTNYKGNNITLFVAGDLPTSSDLRKFCETSEEAAIIACYPDEGLQLQRYIELYLKKQNYNIDQLGVQLLTNTLGGDRLYVNNELDKLMLYMGEEKNITDEEVLMLTSEPLEVNIDALCNYVADSNYQKIFESLSFLKRNNVNFMIIIRSLARYFLRLLQAKNHLGHNMSSADAIKKLYPPVFYKQVNNFTKQLNKWKKSDLIRVNRELIELEISCKKTATPIDLLLEHTLKEIAGIAAK